MMLEGLATLLGGSTLNVKAWGGHQQQTLLSSSMAASSKVPLPPRLLLSQLKEMFPFPPKCFLEQSQYFSTDFLAH